MHNNRLFHYCDYTKKLWLPMSIFMALPEYNASLPTGTIDGKMWKRQKPAHPFYPNMTFYWVCQYVSKPTDKLGTMGIVSYDPIPIVGT